jgi:hypothetical protein
VSYREKGHASACDLYFGKACSCAVGEVVRIVHEREIERAEHEKQLAIARRERDDEHAGRCIAEERLAEVCEQLAAASKELNAIREHLAGPLQIQALETGA